MLTSSAVINSYWCALTINFNDWILTTLINYVFAQSNFEITNQQTTPPQKKTQNPCVFVFVCTLWMPRIDIFLRNHLNLHFAMLKSAAFHRCTVSAFWFLFNKECQSKELIWKVEGKTCIQVSKLWSYGNHWVTSWLTVCRERGLFAVIREIGL